MLNQVGSVGAEMVQAALDFWIEGQLDDTIAAPKLKLFQNNVPINEETVFADLDEATFSGYADIDIATVTWPASSLMADGSALAINTLLRTFLQTAATISNTIYGWYLVDGAETVLLAALPFETPLAFDAAGRFATIEVALRSPAGAVRPESDTTSNAPAA